MIQQHHGTTLVEYFYRQASQQSEARGEGQEVDESSYRYPGPKPQTKEAGVMMLSDVAESACRTLVDPGPARIESLVHDLTMSRLMDGQLSESGLTLEEVHLIGESIVKSLTAVYHGRIKYTEPTQETA
jgi:membrane-associated HD superfamily phosphohydrolase